MPEDLTTVTFFVTATFTPETLERIKGQEPTVSAGIVGEVMNTLNKQWMPPSGVRDVEIDSIRAGDVVIQGSRRRGDA